MNSDNTTPLSSGADHQEANERIEKYESKKEVFNIDFSNQKLANQQCFEEALSILRTKFKKLKSDIKGLKENPDTSTSENNKTESIKNERKKESSSNVQTDSFQDFIPARMINEYVYCPRLFYYEFVEGCFLDNADTLRGSAIHSRVDTGTGAMPDRDSQEETNKTTPGDVEKNNQQNQPETIHARSVMLFSEKLGVSAKIDLVEITVTEENGVRTFLVSPVDYKAGSPKKEEDGNEIWDSDKVQLGLQALLLRENGYKCDEGIIYYRETRQRVHLQITDELEKWIIKQVENARQTALGEIPPPLKNSPKCIRCSLAPVCMPDETTLLSQDSRLQNATPETIKTVSTSGKKSSKIKLREVRRLMAPRDDTRALYLTTQGLKIGRNDEILEIKDNQKVIETVRINDLSHIALFGNIQITTQAIQSLCYAEVPITYFSMGGWFYGITRGHSLKNVFLRINQFKIASEENHCLKFARKFIFGKIRNQRTMLMRNHIDPPEDCIRKMKHLSEMALRAKTIQELLGIEGVAANLYFENFSGMIKANDELDIQQPNPDEQQNNTNTPKNEMTFDFKTRNRRPPTDPINATLSLAYSLLAKDCTIAALAVGFDPYIGFYHRPRFGKPALALDLMEEFRPIIAESVVITAINNRVLNLQDFVQAGKNVNLTPNGRKKFFYIYEQRMNTLFTHPIFDYKITYRRALEIQARLLAKTLTHEIPEYAPIIVR